MNLVIKSFGTEKRRVRVGKSIRTVIIEFFEHDDGMFHAFSHYAMDHEEEVHGMGVSEDLEDAIKLSIHDLKVEWKKRRS